MASLAIAGITWILLILFLYSASNWKRAGVFLVAVVLAGGAVSAVGWHLYGDRIESRMAEDSKGTKGFLGNSTRLGTWKVAIELAARAPTWGAGSRSFESYFQELRPDEIRPWVFADAKFAHNEYLQFNAEYGRIGSVLLGVFLSAHLFIGCRYLLRERKRISGGDEGFTDRWRTGLVVMSIVGLVGGLVHALADFNFHIPSTLGLMAFFCGVLAGSMRADGCGKISSSPSRHGIVVNRVAQLSAGLCAVVILVCGIPYAKSEYLLERATLIEEGAAFAVLKLNLAQRAQLLDPLNPFTFYRSARWRIESLEGARDDTDLQQRVNVIRKEFGVALKLNPRDLAAHLEFAKFLEAICDVEAATAHFLAGLQLAPGYGTVRMEYAKHLERQGRWTEAIAAYEHAGRAKHFHQNGWKQRIESIETELERQRHLD